MYPVPLRVKEWAGPDDKTDSSSYFDNKKRTFQGIVRGRFKFPIQMSECVTGQTFDHPGGPHLPPMAILKGALQFQSFGTTATGPS